MEKRKFKRIAIAILLGIAIILVFALSFLAIYSSTLDYSFDEALFFAAKSSNVTKLYYDKENGARSLESYVPELYEEIYGVTRKEWVLYSEISESLKNAFVSMEDRRFFEHSGVDLKRSLGAALNYALKFRSGFGGSTITQQVVKNISGDNERSARRKLNEILRSINIEKKHSKTEILETYMNIVELGDGIIGVGEAAEYYFGKKASELDYIDAATLVGMANAPTKYNPYKNPEACLEKRNKVLYSLLECGIIDREFYENSKLLPLSVVEKDGSLVHVNSWFSESVIDEVSAALSNKLQVSLNVAKKLLRSGGYKIYTTVSPDMQKILEDYFKDSDNFPSAVDSGLEFSMVISDPEGNLRAVIGGVGEKQGNRILNYAEANITPGSTLKPLALYAPLLNAKKINWASVFDDVPVEFKKNNSGHLYAFPKNTPNVYDGLITVKDALKVSKNTVAVRLYDMLGAEEIYRNLKDNYGFSSLITAERTNDGRILTDLSASPLALGQLTHGVSLRKLTESYNVFSNEGVLSEGRSFIAVFDADGNLVLENKPSEKRVLSKECAEIMNKLLELVVNEGTAQKITLSELVDTAGKTGTSGGGKDKLFIGYTPYFTAGIWCGYKGEKRSVGFLEKDHLDVWNDVAKQIYNSLEIYEGERHFSEDGLLYLPYCRDSGMIFSENCMLDPRDSRMDFGYFTPDNAPSGSCERHVVLKYDNLTKGIATECCPEEELIDIALVKIEDRSFPYEIEITDAEYVMRDDVLDCDYPRNYSVPYFYNSLSDGEYAGKSKGRKQFNSPCYIHRN